MYFWASIRYPKYCFVSKLQSIQASNLFLDKCQVSGMNVYRSEAHFPCICSSQILSADLGQHISVTLSVQEAIKACFILCKTILRSQMWTGQCFGCYKLYCTPKLLFICLFGLVCLFFFNKLTKKSLLYWVAVMGANTSYFFRGCWSEMRLNYTKCQLVTWLWQEDVKFFSSNKL